MSTQTVNGTRVSAYPRATEELLPAARELARELGEIPSRNRLMRDLRIGAPKADALRELLSIDQAGYSSPTLPIPVSPAPVLDGAPVEPVEHSTEPAESAPVRGVDTLDTPAPASVEPAQVTPHGHPGTAAPQSTPGRSLASMLRLRWAVRAVLTLGVAASIAGNVLHANGGIISQIISAWSPLALLLTVELISRVPVHRRSLAVVRWAATAVIAGIAAWVSYWHMAAVASHYGETGGSQYLLPLSVDGLIVVASICLVELGGRIEEAQR